MGKFTMNHDLDCGTERFWKLFFDRDFNAKLYQALEFPEWTLVEQREEEKEIHRVVRATPKLDVPGPVAKVLGDRFSYTETGRFDRASNVYTFAIKPSSMADKMKNEGKITCEPRGEGKSRRVVDVTLEAKIFGIGGLLEGSFEKSYRGGYGKGAEFINRWAKEHP
jgi:hypothetical protein